MNLGEEEDISTYKQNKKSKYSKIRSHLVSEKFLLTIIKVLSSGIPILRRSLMNIKRFLSIIDRKYYSADLTTEALLLTCDMILSTRIMSSKPIDTNSLLFKVDVLLTDQYEETKNNLVIPTIQLAKSELPEDELDFIDQSLDYNLKYSKIIEEKDNLVDMATEISNCSYTDFKDVFANFRGLITDFYNFFRRTDSNTKINQVVHTSEPTFVSFLKDTLETIKNPSSALRTGIQALNSSLGPRGGFQNDNVYMFYANTNSFKSAFLLHLARMVKEYNGDVVMQSYKETGKIPTILFIEGENSMDEDNERLYKMVNKTDMGKCKTEEDLEYNWKHSFDDNPDNPIDISFLHVDSRSMSVRDIDDMIDSLEEEGYHVIMTIIDYLEMIAPNIEDVMKDIRIQYRGIADSLVNLAKNRHIPIVSAHQLNRAGGAVLTNAKSQGSANAISAMTNEFIGESYSVEKAVSYSAFIDIEVHDDKRYFMYKRNKSRFKNFGCDYFVYEIKDGIIFDDDINLPEPLSMEHIPDGTGDGLMKARENYGKRGNTGFNNEKEKPKVKVGEETVIKPKEEEKFTYNKSLMLNGYDWFGYALKYGLENVSVLTDEYSMDNTHIEKIGDTDYRFLN